MKERPTMEELAAQFCDRRPCSAQARFFTLANVFMLDNWGTPARDNQVRAMAHSLRRHGNSRGREFLRMLAEEVLGEGKFGSIDRAYMENHIEALEAENERLKQEVKTVCEISDTHFSKRVEEQAENRALISDNEELNGIIEMKDAEIYNLQQRMSELEDGQNYLMAQLEDVEEHGASNPTHCPDCGDLWEDHNGEACYSGRNEAMKGHPAHTPMEIPHIYWMDLARQGFDFADRLEEGKTWTLYRHVQLLRTLSAYVEKLGHRWKTPTNP